MESNSLSIVLCIIALVLAGIGILLNLMSFYVVYYLTIFIYIPIILIALGLVLMIFSKE